MWKNNWFAKKVDRMSRDSRTKMMIWVMMSKIWFLIQRRSFWFDLCSNTSCMMFSWWSKSDLMIFSELQSTNASSKMIKIVVVCESRLSRKFVCSERSLKQSKRVYYVSFLSIHNESIMLRCFRWMIKIKLSLLCFYSFTEFKDKKFCLFNARVSYNEHDVNNFDIMWNAMQWYNTTT